MAVCEMLTYYIINAIICIRVSIVAVHIQYCIFIVRTVCVTVYVQCVSLCICTCVCVSSKEMNANYDGDCVLFTYVNNVLYCVVLCCIVLYCIVLYCLLYCCIV